LPSILKQLICNETTCPTEITVDPLDMLMFAAGGFAVGSFTSLQLAASQSTRNRRYL